MSRNLFTPPCGFDIADTTITSITEVGAIRYWGHRTVRHTDGQHFIHQAFYDEREGLLGVARQPTFFCADDLDLLRVEVEDAMRSLDEPVLRAEALGGGLEQQPDGSEGTLGSNGAADRENGSGKKPDGAP